MRRKSSMAVGLSAFLCLASTLGCQTDAPAKRNAWGNFNSGTGAAPPNAAAPRNGAPTAGMQSNPYAPSNVNSPSPLRQTGGTASPYNGTTNANFVSPQGNVTGGQPFGAAPTMQTPGIATPSPNVQISQPQTGFAPAPNLAAPPPPTPYTFPQSPPVPTMPNGVPGPQ